MTVEHAANEFIKRVYEPTDVTHTIYDVVRDAFLAGHAHGEDRWIKITDETLPADGSNIWATDGEMCKQIYYKAGQQHAFKRLFTHYVLLPTAPPKPDDNG